MSIYFWHQHMTWAQGTDSPALLFCPLKGTAAVGKGSSPQSSDDPADLEKPSTCCLNNKPKWRNAGYVLVGNSRKVRTGERKRITVKNTEGCKKRRKEGRTNTEEGHSPIETAREAVTARSAATITGLTLKGFHRHTLRETGKSKDKLMTDPMSQHRAMARTLSLKSKDLDSNSASDTYHLCGFGQVTQSPVPQRRTRK